MARFETINLEFDKPRPNVATLTFSRPNALNALNSQVSEDLRKAIEMVEENRNLRALIVTGDGDKAFIAGADIAEMVKLTPPQARNFLYTLQHLLNRFERLSIPIIARINGYALGGGLETALACDIRIASENAVLGLPEVTLGLIPAGGGTQRLTRVIGEGRAKNMILLAKRVKAQEALNLGIVTSVVPQTELDAEVDRTLDTLLNLAPVSLGAAKHAIQIASDEKLISGLEIELDEAVRCFQTKDLREGMNAFLEKRKAEFSGK